MQNRASRTAEQVALFRALETARKDDRLFDDPQAERLLPVGYRLLARLARVRAIGDRLEAYIDQRWSGPRASAVARTRLIDDLVTAAPRVRQVLLLGAGYDSRAARLPALADVPVYEVDHPATQAVKRRRLGAPGNVRFVPADLLVDDLGVVLERAGFRGGAVTVVIWEGVTNYLTAEAVDATLRRLVTLTGAGSRIIFTYIDRAVLTGEMSAGLWHAAVGRQGESWTFGFDPAELPGYLADRGLRLTLDMSTADAADRYLTPNGRPVHAATFYHVAEAEVR